MESIQISGIQHFAYCRRQWALIHIEQQWQDNVHTVEGELMHARAHDAEQIELRGDVLTVRGMRIESRVMNVTGSCDVVEFRRSPDGIKLSGRDGLWDVYPIEYKKGKPKPHNADELQLCAEAMCLEEMLMCTIQQAALYYAEPRRRTVVSLTEELRAQVKADFEEMHRYMEQGYTPQVKRHKGCASCSLCDVCLPELSRLSNVSDYIRRHLKEDDK